MTHLPVDAAALRELVDRQQILDCLHRYARGIDRLDGELLLSAYHADAIDDHGAFVGSPAELAEFPQRRGPFRSRGRA